MKVLAFVVTALGNVGTIGARSVRALRRASRPDETQASAEVADKSRRRCYCRASWTTLDRCACSVVCWLYYNAVNFFLRNSAPSARPAGVHDLCGTTNSMKISMSKLSETTKSCIDAIIVDRYTPRFPPLGLPLHCVVSHGVLHGSASRTPPYVLMGARNRGLVRKGLTAALGALPFLCRRLSVSHPSRPSINSSVVIAPISRCVQAHAAVQGPRTPPPLPRALVTRLV